jgi:hypothetical protein
MKTKQKNNKILPTMSACCWAVVRNECRNHLSFKTVQVFYSSTTQLKTLFVEQKKSNFPFDNFQHKHYLTNNSKHMFSTNTTY